MPTIILPVIDTNSIGWTFNPPTNAFANVLAQESVTVTTGGVALVHDSAAPGNNQYYGTNASGTKGFFAVTAAAGSLTVQEIDGSPSVTASTIRFQNGTLTDDGGGQVTFRDVTTNRQTLSTDLTLTGNSPRYQNLNPNGASRIVNLPALAGGLAFFIVNSGTLSETITIKNAAVVTVTTAANNNAVSLVCDGTVWIASPTSVTIV
jgi:hypothetical protein